MRNETALIPQVRGWISPSVCRTISSHLLPLVRVQLLPAHAANQTSWCAAVVRARIIPFRVIILSAARKKWVLHFPHRGFGTHREFKVFFLCHNDDGRLETKEENKEKLTVMLSQYLYTIMTLRSMQSVKKKRPSM